MDLLFIWRIRVLTWECEYRADHSGKEERAGSAFIFVTLNLVI